MSRSVVKKWRGIRVMLVAFCLVLTPAPCSTVRASPVFGDTAGIVEEPHIARLKALGIITGDESGNFNPGGRFTRMEAATLAVRLSGLGRYAPSLDHPTRFPDVQERHRWAWGYINVAVAQGLVKGLPDGTFLPDEPITQLQAVVLFLNALGYAGTIPGGWPNGYIAKGIETGIISQGFQPDQYATRAFVAKVADLSLEREVVREKEGSPGEYEGTGKSLYEEVFRGTVLDKPVMVMKVDEAPSRLQLEGFSEAVDCAPAVVIYGKEKLADLEGHLVVGATNSGGALVFVQVVTPAEINGVVSHVDPEARKMVVGGVSVEVEDGVYVEKNGVEQLGNLAARLRSVLNADARVYVRNGRAYRVVAHLFEKLAGQITGRRVTYTPAGPEFFVSIEGREYRLAQSATLLRNGKPSEFSDFRAGDPCLYAVEEGAIVYLDAWKVELGNVLVVEKISEAGEFAVVVEREGLRTSYRLRDTAVFEDPDLVPGAYCTLLVDRDQVVYDVSPPSELPQLTGKIKEARVRIEDSVLFYTLVLEDGSSFRWTEGELAQVAVLRNGRVVSAPPVVTAPAQAVWSMFVPGEEIKVTFGPGGSPRTVDLFTPGKLQGIAFSVSRGPLVTSLQLQNAVGSIFAQFDLENSTPITLNGEHDVAGSISDGDIVRFRWDVSAGRPVDVCAVRFAELVPQTVAEVSRDDDDRIWFLTAQGVEVRPEASGGIVFKDGSGVSLEDVSVGDKIRYNFTPPFNYLEAYSDQDKPGYRHAVAQWSEGTLRVVLWFDEEIWQLKASVDRTERTFEREDAGGTRWRWVSQTDYPEEPASVTLSFEARDYAGNILTKTLTVPVTGPESVELPSLVPRILPPF